MKLGTVFEFYEGSAYRIILERTRVQNTHREPTREASRNCHCYAEAVGKGRGRNVRRGELFPSSFSLRLNRLRFPSPLDTKVRSSSVIVAPLWNPGISPSLVCIITQGKYPMRYSRARGNIRSKRDDETAILNNISLLLNYYPIIFTIYHDIWVSIFRSR